MEKLIYVAHINCSPWIEDGEWNIVLEKKYHMMTGIDTEENFNMVDKILTSAIDTGSIDSYYIQRANHPMPVKHAQ